MSVFTNPPGADAAQTAAYVSAVLDLVGNRDPLSILRETPERLRAIVDTLPPAQLRRPEMPGKWSIGQVLQHLADSEVVWAWRMRLILAQDRPQITGYDQERWAERLRYDLAEPRESVEEFSVLRRSNLRLLERASGEDLKRVGMHAERGEESIERLRQLYAGHDLLHLRQIERIRTAAAAP